MTLVLSAVLVGVVVARSIRALTGAGPEMDEGDTLAFGDQVLHGAVPWRDFESFYGPANAYFVAAAFRVLGTTVLSERLVGLSFRIALCIALLAIAARFGRAELLGTGLVLVFLVPAMQVWASADAEAIAATAVTLAFLAGAQHGVQLGRPSRVLELAAGISMGVAVLIRFDYILAAVLVAVPFLVRRGISWRRFGLGLGVTAGLYLPLLAATGPAKLTRIAGDVERGSQAGRRLPLPSFTTYPGNLLLVLVLALTVLIVVGGVSFIRGQSIESRIWLAAGLASLGTLPHALTRPDQMHVVPMSVLPLTLLPTLLKLVRFGQAGALIGLVGSIALLVPSSGSHGFAITHGGRTFRIAEPAAAANVQQIVDAAAAAAPKGSRLFVGPLDLRRTNYADTYIYFLLPEFRPASFYIDLAPGTLNHTARREISALADADLLILTSRYDRWNEPNTSRNYGTSAGNVYVNEHFCLRVGAWNYELFVRKPLGRACPAPTGRLAVDTRQSA